MTLWDFADQSLAHQPGDGSFSRLQPGKALEGNPTDARETKLDEDSGGKSLILIYIMSYTSEIALIRVMRQNLFLSHSIQSHAVNNSDSYRSAGAGSIRSHIWAYFLLWPVDKHTALESVL